MTELIITRGLPASGKSTWATQWVQADPENRVRLNRDATRMMLAGVDTKPAPGKFEQQITKMHHDFARQALRSGVSVIVDDTNLRARYAKDWARLASVVGVGFRVQDFTDVPVEECIRRNAERENGVPDDLITVMHQKFIKGGVAGVEIEPQQSLFTPYVPNPQKPDAYLVDIDGTLAMKGDRDIYDGSKAHLDTVIEDVARVVRGLHPGSCLIYVSGRSDEHYGVTREWLDVNGFPVLDGLYMRKAGDKRKDSIVKHELFNEHIRDHYNIRGVFDDRNQVVEMWREIGLTVFQVADGNF